MNVGAFAVVSHFANAGERYVTLEDYEGLGRRLRCWRRTLTIFLLSLIGIPMTGGFFAKFYVFSAALQSEPDMAHAHRRGQQRDRRLLLSPHHRRDVHAGIAQSRFRWLPFRSASDGSRDQRSGTLYLGILPNRVLQYRPALGAGIAAPSPADRSARRKYRLQRRLPHAAFPAENLSLTAFDKRRDPRASCLHQVQSVLHLSRN